jgi:ABC-type dipeptide/oligopeptide/nickel transport system permease component
MFPFIVKRLGLALLVALAVSIVGFVLLRLSGDVASAIAGEGARQEDVELVRRTYGLDRPLVVQYLEWLGRTLTGDFGTSLYFKTDVIGLVLDKLPTTLTLGVLSLVLIMLFSIQLRWLPVSGSGTWAHFVMPTIALGYYIAPAFMRLVRAGMVEVLSADYIRTARAKGLPTRIVVFKHALRNAVVPVVALAAVQLGFLLGGSVVVETIFALDGLGYLAYQSITHKDFPVTQAVVMLLSVFYVLLTLMADVANAWLDPRIRVA